MSTTFSLRPPISKCRHLDSTNRLNSMFIKKSIRSQSVRCSFLIINPSTFLHTTIPKFQAFAKLFLKQFARILTTISKDIIRSSKINRIIDQKHKFPCSKQNRRKREEARQVELGGPLKRKREAASTPPPPVSPGLRLPRYSCNPRRFIDI